MIRAIVLGTLALAAYAMIVETAMDWHRRYVLRESLDRPLRHRG